MLGRVGSEQCGFERLGRTSWMLMTPIEISRAFSHVWSWYSFEGLVSSETKKNIKIQEDPYSETRLSGLQ